MWKQLAFSLLQILPLGHERYEVAKMETYVPTNGPLVLFEDFRQSQAYTSECRDFRHVAWPHTEVLVQRSPIAGSSMLGTTTTRAPSPETNTSEHQGSVHGNAILLEVNISQPSTGSHIPHPDPLSITGPAIFNDTIQMQDNAIMS